MYTAARRRRIRRIGQDTSLEYQALFDERMLRTKVMALCDDIIRGGVLREGIGQVKETGRLM